MKWITACGLSLLLLFPFGPRLSRADIPRPGTPAYDRAQAAIAAGEKAKRDKAVHDQLDGAPVHAVAGGLVVCSTLGSLTALYFVRRWNAD
jgi:hypothetical protein